MLSNSNTQTVGRKNFGWSGCFSLCRFGFYVTILKYDVTRKTFGGFEVIYPKEEFGSTYQIPFEEFYDKGYRGIIFDIDNTLVPHGAPADERSIRLCNHLKELGYQICFVSNNNERRVAPFAQAMGAKYISNAGKPFKRGYQQAAEILQVEADKILFVGDQLLTDIIGANRVGYYSVLVGPIQKKESFWIVLKRMLESVCLHFYRRSRKYNSNTPNRRGYEENIPEHYR